MYIAAELDAVTPADGVVGMHARTGESKKLWMIPAAAQQDVYREELVHQILDMSVDWMTEHLPES